MLKKPDSMTQTVILRNCLLGLLQIFTTPFSVASLPVVVSHLILLMSLLISPFVNLLEAQSILPTPAINKDNEGLHLKARPTSIEMMRTTSGIVLHNDAVPRVYSCRL
jgi:hypothetical protein